MKNDVVILSPDRLREIVREAALEAAHEALRVGRAEPEPERRMLTSDEAMERLRCKRSKLYNLRREGKLKAVTLGQTLLFDPDEIDALLEGREI